jgi:glutamate racemase
VVVSPADFSNGSVRSALSDDRPIGMFDSGLGGLTVARSVIDLLPNERLVYFADTGRFPYGPRPAEEVRRFAVEIAKYLAGHDVKMLVVACNTATAAALDDVRDAVDVPVIGVIDPAVRAAVRATRNERVGLIGTVGTVASGSYERALARLDATARIQMVSQACPQFVDFVERGDTTSPELLGVAERYLALLKVSGIDTLILGCTHYPLLRGTLHHVMGPEVLLVSSADETASDVYDILTNGGLLRRTPRPPEHRFESSGDTDRFATLLTRFLGEGMQGAERVVLAPTKGPAWS